ncbi:MAG: hypothetical protein ABJP79_04665 [Tateyamaria sp.]|uniref:DUF7507 domain-containing protein n=1 Tax=Tateyamaria sp. TaxID=1929288 RepID=UPI00329ACA6A
MVLLARLFAGFWTLALLLSGAAWATPFTTTVPGTSITLPDDYPEAGGVAFVFIGNNGNLYFQFSNPEGAFRGFNSNGVPTQFRGNPFTINDPVVLDCGFSTCTDYFGGGIQEIHIRFSAFDGDTQVNGFDEDDISLILNGTNVGSWSGLTTEITDNAGTQSFGFANGFGNNTFNTGWFSSTNPGLLSNILTTNQTTTQVLDDDPNDNFWDFRRGNNLTNPSIVTVAPGYTLAKTANVTDFDAVGDEIEYTFIVTNIGSVSISDLSVFDDVIGAVSCDTTVINSTSLGGTPESATCTATYEVTQEDVDRGFVTNTANAEGTPDFGELGTLTDEVTVDGPAADPILFVEKTSTLGAFGNADTTVPYSFLIRNDGNVTLSNVQVNDPLLPGLVCSPPDLAPDAEFTCSGTYTVLQSDVDDFAANAADTLDNTVTVTAETPAGAGVTQTDDLSLPGPAAAPGIDVTKTAQVAEYDAVGDVLTYQIRVDNTGNVSYPVPTITDVLTAGATCPAGDIAPGSFVLCTATYDVLQDDINAGQVDNEASAEVTVGGVTVSDSDVATVPAVLTTGLTLDKRLASTSPSNFAAENVGLTYEYVLSNTGNVTLLTPTVTDDLVSVSCVETEILPFTSITCTSDTYLTTQLDLNEGDVTNIASATATQAGPTPTAITSNTDTVTVPAVQQPELTLVKTAPLVDAIDYVEGAIVTYSFEVTNDGNIDLTTDTVNASDITITDDRIGTFTCQPTPLNVGDSISCTAEYELTFADIQAGTVVNTATASAGAVESDQVSAQIAPTFMPTIGLVKAATTASVGETTDSISYTFEVTNTGDTTLILPDNAISITDPLLSAVADCSAQPASFAPGDSFECVGARNGVTQIELDAGQVDNAATAAFDFTNNGTTIAITSNESTATVPVIADPEMVFTKSGPPQFDAFNQSLTYTFEVENTGNVTLSEVSVTDPLIPGLVCTLTDVAPGATDSCTGSYSVTQPNVDAEVINNTATATAIPTQGPQLSETASAVVPIDPTVPSMTASLTKQASTPTFTAVNEQITYTMSVANTGTQTLSDLVVTDVLDPAFSCDIATLAPGATDTTCVFVHSVTQADIDAGEVVNVATLASPEITTQTATETVTGPARTATYEFEKQVSGNYTAENDVVSYTFRVENTGNVTLSNLVVTDPFFGAPINCTIPSLAPGAVDSTTCVADYTIIQADVDAGSITNTADITVDAPAGVTDPADQDSTAVSTGPVENAAISVVKAFTDGTYSSATDSEDYTFTVTNDGNVTLTNVVLTDPMLGFTCTLADLGPGDVATTCDDGSPLAATQNFDQSDVDAGSFTNTVEVTGESAVLATPVDASDEVTVTGPAQVPTISLAKNSTFTGTLESVGQVLTYDFVVTNTGNVTLTAEINVADDLIPDVSCPAITGAGIAPGGTLTCTGSYEVTQIDLDAGEVLNEATASMTQPIVPQNPGDDPFITISSNLATATVTADQQPELRLEKRVQAGSASSFADVNDVVTFEYVVTNIGNVTTTDPITIVDDQITGTLECTAAPVAPGASVTCDQDWIAEQIDIDAGSVTNIATASTVFDGATVDSGTDSVTVNAIQTPELSIVKTFLNSSDPTAFNEFDVLTYEIVVTNTGNVTIDAPITLTDNLSIPSCPAVPGDELAPGDTLTCPSTHIVTANDIALGSATNVVFATGSFDGSPVQSPSDDAIFPVDAMPALSLTKTARADNVPFDAIGQIITYDYVVTNTGNVGLAGEITIEDDVIGTIACKPAAPPTLATGTSFDCEATHEITQDDIDRGFVTNNATAQTLFPPESTLPTQVVSPNAEETVLADEDPELTVTKAQISGIATASEGDTLTYQITALNSGNQTIAGASISDPLLPTLTCTVGGSAAPANVILLPGEALVCEGDYVVTQDDVDAQTLVNTASATGTDPQGVTISDDDIHTQDIDAPVVAMTVNKAIVPDPGAADAFTDPGQELQFVISVQNTGNITLSEAVITDDRLVTPVSCLVGPIEPGETDDSCVFTYTVTQADLDEVNGVPGAQFSGFTNTATIVATPNNTALDPINDTADVFVRGPPQDPAFNLVKESTTDEIISFNQRIEYTFTIANTGNITLFEEPQIVDDKIGTFVCEGLPVGGIAPSEFYQCTAEYFVTQADLDAGFVTNTATATSSELEDPVVTELTIDGARNPGISVVKTPNVLANVAEGETINYTYVVTNTGNVTLTGVTLVDQHTSAAGTAPLPITGESLTGDVNETDTSVDTDGPGIFTTLGPGDTVTFTAEFTVTQDDIDAEISIDNTATITGLSPDGTTPQDTSSASVTLELGDPGLSVTKTADSSDVSDPAVVGETVSYRIEVANTGNQTLTNVDLTDSFVDGNDVALPITLTLDSGDDGIEDALEVGETWVFIASFDLTQAAIDSGELENTVSVTADDPQGEELSDALAQPVIVDLSQDPGLEVEKSADSSAVTVPAEVGQEIIYTIEVANTGNVTLTDVELDDTFEDGAGNPLAIEPVLISGDDGVADVLEVGETWVFQVTYALTQDVIDSGLVSNTVSVDADDPTGALIEDAIDAPVEVPLSQDPALVIVKSATVVPGPDGRVDAGDTIAYRYEVTNTGNVTLFDLSVTETGFTGLGVTPVPVLESGGADLDGEADGIDLAVTGGTVVFLVDYVLTQDDIDAGEVENAATASATPPIGAAIEDLSGSAVDNDDPTVTPLVRAPGLQTLKTAVANLSTPPAVDDVIFYTISVENTGNVTLSAPVLSDDITTATGGVEALEAAPVFDSGDLNDDDLLSVGETWTFTAEYRLTQDAIDDGGVENTATATSQDPEGADISDVSDDGVGPADGDDPTVTAFDQTAAIAVVKGAALDLGDDGVASVGDEVTYTYTVTNEGNVSLLDVTLEETAFGGAGTTPVPALQSGGSDIDGETDAEDLAVGDTMIWQAVYALEQDDIDAGEVSNQATVGAGTETAGGVSDVSGDATDNDDPNLLDIPEAPGLEVTKTADVTALADPVVEGNQITFTVTAENTGNVTLSNIVLTDTFTRRDGTELSLEPILQPGDSGVAGAIDVNETWVYTVTYTLTQADIDAGGVENQVVVDAETDQGTLVSDTSDDGNDADGDTAGDPTLVTIGGEPEISLVKREAIGSPNPFDAVDQVISYAFDVTNDGNITLTAPIQISDPLIAGQGTGPISCPAPPIAPGDTVTCTGSYRVMQEDLDAGQILNSATALIEQPLVPQQAGDPTSVDVTTGPETVIVPAEQRPSVVLTKVLSPSSPVSYSAVDDTISYDFTIENTGNVTLAGPLTVNDDVIGNGLACDAGPLAPGASVSCTHTYDTTQDDLNAGLVTNTASGLANFNNAPIESPEVSVTVPAIQTPELSFVKALQSATPELFDENTVLAYSFTVTNTGNVTIDAPISINDPVLDSASCPAPAGDVLQPGDALTCTGSHTLTASNVSLGAFVNVASASGSFDGDPVTSLSDDAIFPVDAEPTLALTKDSVPSDITFATLGEEITYTYTVLNNSSVGFTEDISINDNRIENPILCHDASEDGVFNVGDSATCRAVYEVTQADLDAGEVVNEALATTIFAPGTANEQPVFSPAAVVTVVADEDPALTLGKVISDAPAEAAVDDEIEFTLTATNSGNQTIAGVTITDPLIGVLTCSVDDVAAPANVVLLPGQALVCVGNYTVTQDDIDDQSLTNDAQVTGSDPQGETIEDDASVVVPLTDEDAVIRVVKAVEPAPTAGAPSFVNVDDVVNFRITVFNDGNVTLQNITVSDALTVVPSTCPIDELAPGQSDSSCLVAYTVTQADINGAGVDPFGGFDNTASAVGTAVTPDATQVEDDDTIFVRGPDSAPALDLDKTADVPTVALAGDTITYSYLVTNVGNITLSEAISVSDDRIANVNCPALPVDGLAPGAAITCSADYEVTQADIDVGAITNIATATSSEAVAPATPGDETDSVTVPVAVNPSLSLVKTPSVTADVTEGTVITYTYAVTNDGNQTLTDVSVSDAQTSAAGTVALIVSGEQLTTDAVPTNDSTDGGADGVWDVLRPGDVVSFTADYTVTQADIDQQVVLANTATAQATDPNNTPLTDTVDVEVTTDPAAPEVQADKVISATSTLSDPPAPGDIVNFDITIENAGNQTLDTVSLTDTLRRADGTEIAIASPVLTGGDVAVAGELLPGEIWTFSAFHVLTQDDINAGGISNQVVVQSFSPNDTLVTDTSDDGNDANGDTDPTVLLVPSLPAIAGEKTVLVSAGAVDETITFQISAINTGNVTLTDVAVASDTLTRIDGVPIALTSEPIFTGSTLNSGAGTLLPNEVATYTATYTLTQADIDAGGVENSAVVTGTPPVGSPLTDVTDDGIDTDGNTDNDATEVLVPAQPSIALGKQPSAAAPVSFSVVGTEIPYDFIVENTGNVTLFETPEIIDPLITDAGGAITCPALPADGLAPQATTTCTGSYFVTQADIDNESVDNTATANLGDLTSDPSVTSTPAVQLPELTMVKSAPEIEAVDFVTGLEIIYTFTTTNTGNTTIFDQITVNDTLIPTENIVCPVFPEDGLAPNDAYVCNGTYTVTPTDVSLTSITNLASSTDGETTSTIDSVTVPNDGVPSLSIDKVATETDFDAVDDVLNFTFTVTNSGTQAFAQPVVVTDTLIGDVACFTPSQSNPDLVAGEVATCSANYSVTQADLDRGFVLNEAFASTTFGADDTLVLSPPDAVTVDADLAPELTIEKSAAALPITGVDQELTYTIVVTNSGNQTLTNVSATDALLDGFVCEADVLDPDGVLTCTGAYTVLQGDIDAGSLTNTADVSGVSPQGDLIDAETSLVLAVPAPAPAVSLVKEATPTPFGPVDSTLTYLFTVENTGNVTLNDLTITDVMDPDFACVIPSLAPGVTNQTCSLEISVTQAMIDDGFVVNTASVTGNDPSGTVTSDDATLSTQGPVAQPALVATKVVLPAPGVVGAVVPFVLSVENTGNVTLEDLVIVDQMVNGNGQPIALDAPFVLTPSTDINGDELLSVGEVWTYTAQLTLTQGIVNSGGVSNQVTATGTDPNGTNVSDLSDNGNDADGNATDDPTVFDIAAAPELFVVKSIETSGSTVGDEVVFVITATNVGNVALTGVTVADQLTRLNGASLPATPIVRNVPEPLDSGAEATWEVRHTLTQEDIDAGGLSNSASVTGTTPDNVQVSDTSSDDDPTDGNVTDDPTVLPIAPVPSMEVIKTATDIGTAAGETVTYEITVENTGSVTLTGITLADTLTDVDGQTPRSPALSFVSADGTPASVEGTLVPGETATYTSSVTLLQSDIEAGGLSNSVLASAQTSVGGSLQDLSDDDGTGDNDPTVISITPEPSLNVVKTSGTVSVVFPTVEQVTFDITVQNTGNIIQTGIDLQDNLAAFAAPAILQSETYPIVLTASGFTDGTANTSFDGINILSMLSGNPTLAPGETGTVSVTLVYSTATGAPGSVNTASATSDQLSTPAIGTAEVTLTDTDGDGVPDNIETDGDRDGDGIPDAEDFDPTGYFYCEDTGAILSGGQISVSGGGFTQTGVGTTGPIVVVSDGSVGAFQFFVTAPGSYTLNLTYPPVGAPSTTRTTLGSIDATTLPNPASLGSNEFGTTGVLADSTAGANPFYTTFVFEPGDPIILNNNIPVMGCADASGIQATKSIDRTTAVFGETVNYTLTFTNNGTSTLTNAQIVDRLPGGLVYTPTTARVDGAAVEPVFSGGSMLWTVDLAPAQTITVTFAARVRRTGDFGVLTNRTWLQDANGTQVSNTAQADLRISPEHVFDCSDVIGKVFDDKNSNGYQDYRAPRGITNQTFQGGKFETAVEDDSVIEPGIPGVRLVTPDGLLITTDPHGRFSIPCAALPKNIGSNFQLKLDTRTLPSGYRVTTENPRNIRLTAGKIAKMNFGAALGQVVRIDLNASAFVPTKATPSAQLDGAVDGLLQQIAATPSVLRLTYALTNNEDPKAARARLKALEDLIRKRWRGTGKYKLIIERTVTRGGQ